MKSFREEIAARVLDPQQFIKQAEERAKKSEEIFLESEQKDSEKNSFSLNENDSVTKQADSVIAGIKTYLEESNVESDKSVGIKKQAGDGDKKTEKSAAAKMIDIGIFDDTIKEALDKAISEENLGTDISGIENIDIKRLNEKVAGTIGKIFAKLKKPALLAAGGTAAGAAGFGAGLLKGKQGLRDYISADKKRDQANMNKAFQFGQATMYEKLRRALTRGGTNG